MLSLPMAPLAGSDLLRKLLPKLLSADDDTSDEEEEEFSRRRAAAAATDDGSDAEDASADAASADSRREEELRRLAEYLGLRLPSSPSSTGTGAGIYGLADEIVVAEDAPEEDASSTIDPAVLASLGLTPEDVALHNDRVRSRNADRHLSRYERQHRIEHDLDDIDDIDDLGLDLGLDDFDDASESEAEDQDASAERHDGLLRQRNLLVNTPYHGVHPYQTTPLSQGYGTHCEYLFPVMHFDILIYLYVIYIYIYIKYVHYSSSQKLLLVQMILFKLFIYVA